MSRPPRARNLELFRLSACAPGRMPELKTLPVPGDAIHDGQITVRLTITQLGAPPRVPTAQEVRGVKLKVAGASR